MKFNLTGRDFKFFILGILTAFIISVIYDWEGSKESFKKGYHDGSSGEVYGKSKEE